MRTHPKQDGAWWREVKPDAQFETIIDYHLGYKRKVFAYTFTDTCFPSTFKCQCVKPEWQRPPHGTQLVSEVNPELETNSDLTDKQRRQTCRDPHGMINKYARTHTRIHIKYLLHLHVWLRLHLLSSFSLSPLPPYSCLTCLTASFVISNHLLFERLWQTGVLAASVWCWELGFPAE